MVCKDCIFFKKRAFLYIGTSSAVRLKSAFPQSQVTLISDDFSPHTVSDGSGGFWQPHLAAGTPSHKIK